VGPTIHTAADYRVRGFRLMAGRLQVAMLAGRDGESREREYLRVVDPELLWLCGACAADPALIRELQPDWSETPAS